MGNMSLVYIFSQVFQYTVLILGIYFFGISTFGWIKFKEKKGKDVKPEKRFALIASAYNEEAVIAQLVDSLVNLDYPKELYDVYIIADNCTDKTADIAKEHGANVFVRFNKVQKGKGYAIEWCFNKIFDSNKQYDAFCIFDADNLVHKNFLLEMNKQFCKGYKAASPLFTPTQQAYNLYLIYLAREQKLKIIPNNKQSEDLQYATQILNELLVWPREEKTNKYITKQLLQIICISIINDYNYYETYLRSANILPSWKEENSVFNTEHNSYVDAAGKKISASNYILASVSHLNKLTDEFEKNCNIISEPYKNHEIKTIPSKETYINSKSR